LYWGWAFELKYDSPPRLNEIEIGCGTRVELWSWEWELTPYITALQASKSNGDHNQTNIDQAVPKDFCNVVASQMDWNLYEQWLDNRYSETYATLVLIYSRKYFNILHDIRTIDLIKQTNKNNVIKSLSVLTKFLGLSTEFNSKLHDYGVKRYRTDSLQTFLRILKASDSDILDWYTSVTTVLRPNEQLYIKFVKMSGLRMKEAINSFNLLIDLGKQNKLSDYYDKELNCLCHFKYPKLFLRGTKNTYITFLPESMINEIASSSSVNYQPMQKRIKRNHKTRINELRDFYGTWLVNHNVSRDEQDLLCGRIPISIFIKHYWSPKLKELRDRVFKALELMP
jgi:intergrase/recombinase